VVDTQVYSNTGGQACTSGFIGQVSDMAPYGPVWRGKEETRKEMALISMAHRTTFTVNGAISNYTHLIESYIDGLNSRRPALWNIYAPCPPEHAIPDDASERQSRLAVESRAYPLMVFNPDAGETWEECLSLDGNPAMDDDWPNHALNYEEEDGTEGSMELPTTFADFALTEGRFRKHFRMAPRDTWNENMLPLGEFIDLEEEDREGMYPFIWAVDKKSHLMRVICSSELVESTEERRDYWRTVKGLAGMLEQIDPDQIAQDVRVDMAQKLASGLFSMVTGGSASTELGALMAATPTGMSDTPASKGNGGMQPAAVADVDYESVWIDTPQCTACDECIEINPKMFIYNDEKKAIVTNPKAGSFKDIVRSAEKCTADCIHPGTPWNPGEKGLDKLVKRAEKYQ